MSLASTSRPGCGRRCLRASCAAPLASRLDGVQGPFEKIYFQDLLGQHPLELADLFPERGFARIRRRSVALPRLKLFPPRIQQPPTDAEFLREFYDVVALRQPVHGHLPKGLWKLAHAFLRHLPPPPWCQVCQFAVSQSRGSVHLELQVLQGAWIYVIRGLCTDLPFTNFR